MMEKDKIENLVYETIDEVRDNEYYVLIIYDISSNKIRNKFVRLLKGYGLRVQKSSFEAFISKSKFNKMLKDISKFNIDKEIDSIRVYKILNRNQVFLFGNNEYLEGKKIIII